MQVRKIGLVIASMSCVVLVAACAGCAQPAEESTPDPEVVTQYLPEVIEQDDGTRIQRTPTEG